MVQAAEVVRDQSRALLYLYGESFILERKKRQLEANAAKTKRRQEIKDTSPKKTAKVT